MVCPKFQISFNKTKDPSERHSRLSARLSMKYDTLPKSAKSLHDIDSIAAFLLEEFENGLPQTMAKSSSENSKSSAPTGGLIENRI